VDIKGRVGGAGLTSTREAGRTINLTRNSSNSCTSITIEPRRSKAILPKLPVVSPAKSVSFFYLQRSFVLQHEHQKIFDGVHINE
jgi:hypothetical protein